MSGGPDCSDHPDPESDNNAIASDEVKKNIYTYLCYMYTGSICNEIVYATVMDLSSSKSLLPSPICEFHVFSFMKFLSLIQHNRIFMVNIPQKACMY